MLDKSQKIAKLQDEIDAWRIAFNNRCADLRSAEMEMEQLIKQFNQQLEAREHKIRELEKLCAKRSVTVKSLLAALRLSEKSELVA